MKKITLTSIIEMPPAYVILPSPGISFEGMTGGRGESVARELHSLIASSSSMYFPSTSSVSFILKRAGKQRCKFFMKESLFFQIVKK